VRLCQSGQLMVGHCALDQQPGAPTRTPISMLRWPATSAGAAPTFVSAPDIKEAARALSHQQGGAEMIFDRLMQETDPALSRRSFLTVGAAWRWPRGGRSRRLTPGRPAEAAAAVRVCTQCLRASSRRTVQVTVDPVSYVEMGRATYTTSPMRSPRSSRSTEDGAIEHAPRGTIKCTPIHC